jgi:hypothetical protein
MPATIRLATLCGMPLFTRLAFGWLCMLGTHSTTSLISCRKSVVLEFVAVATHFATAETWQLMAYKPNKLLPSTQSESTATTRILWSIWSKVNPNRDDDIMWKTNRGDYALLPPQLIRAQFLGTVTKELENHHYKSVGSPKYKFFAWSSKVGVGQ